MNYTKVILVFILYIVCLPTKGQHKFGVKIAGGWSKISTNINSSSPTPLEFKFMPSYQGGLSYNFHFKNKSIIGAELLFSKIEGKEHSEQPATDEYGNYTGQLITSDISRHISYFSIPIYYGFNYKKFGVNIGLQTSLTLTSKGQSKSTIPDGNGGFLDFNLNADKLSIKNYDFGTRGALSFALTKKFIFEVTYYYGLLNIYKNDTAKWKWSVQQITIGIKYNIIKIRVKNKE